MAKPFSQAGGGRNPDLLVTTINQAWNKPGAPEGVIYPKLCFVANGGGSIEEFPMSAAAVGEKEVADDAERDFSTAYVIDVVSRSRRIDGPAILLPLDDSRDPYQILQDSGPAIIRRGDRLWDRRLAAAMNSNPVCYDLKTMYATDHPVNPSVAGSDTYSNDISAEMDEAGLIAALQALLDIPGADGNRYNADLGVPTIIVPTVQLGVKARKLITPGLIAKVFGANTAAASENTRLEGMAEVEVLSELNDSKVANSNKRWYVSRTNAHPVAPWIVRITRRIQLTLTAPDAHLATTRNSRGLFYWASGGVDPGLPQTQVRCTTA